MSRLTRSSPDWLLALTTVVALICGVAVSAILPERGLDNAPQFRIFLGITAAWAVVACCAAWTARDRAAAPSPVLAVAVLLRLALLAAPESLSDDLFRYLWEGKVANAGFNPFFHPPSDPALAALRDGIWARVNHPDVPTVYPPAALLLFRAAAASHATPWMWRAMAALADLGVLAGIVGVSKARGLGGGAAVLYALHPLPALESACGGHLESFALAFWVMGVWARDRGRLDLALPAVALGGLVKLLPAVSVLTLLRGQQRGRLTGLAAALALVLAAALPLVALGGATGDGMSRYYESWSFNATFFRLLAALVGDAQRARTMGVLLGAAWCALALWRRRDPVALSLDVAGALLLLSPVVHPWYALWAFVPALLRGSVPWIVFASTAPLSYTVLDGYDPTTGLGWEEPKWLLWSQILPFVAALCLAPRTRSEVSAPEPT